MDTLPLLLVVNVECILNSQNVAVPQISSDKVKYNVPISVFRNHERFIFTSVQSKENVASKKLFLTESSIQLLAIHPLVVFINSMSILSVLVIPAPKTLIATLGVTSPYILGSIKCNTTDRPN